MLRCIIECLTTFVGELGWYAVAAVAGCIVLGLVSTAAAPAVILACLGITLGGAALAGLVTCINACR